MPNAQLDQFIHALEAEAVPPLFVAILGAALLGLLFKRLEHALVRAVRSARARQVGKVVTNTNVRSAGIIRHCPICHSQMVKRKARRGSRAGQEFWGCPNYPDCRGTRPVWGKSTVRRQRSEIRNQSPRHGESVHRRTRRLRPLAKRTADETGKAKETANRWLSGVILLLGERNCAW